MIGEVVVALMLGLIVANVFKLPEPWGKAITFGEKKVLGWAIGLMGLQLSIMKVQDLAWLLPVVLIMILLSLYLGEKAANRFGVSKGGGILIGAGNAICGSAAIAALSPVIKAKPYETGVSISVIQILGTVGMLVIPALASILPMDDTFLGGIERRNSSGRWTSYCRRFCC